MIDRILARLARVTSTGALIPEIDGLRFIAIITVVLFHIDMMVTKYNTDSFGPAFVQGLLHTIAAQGYIGVRLFFAISGFILCLPFASAHLQGKPRPNLKKYLLRRVTRLEPPYIINLLLFATLLLLIDHQPLSKVGPHLLASMGYLHNQIFGTGSFINFVAWSLEIEVQFYLLAPLLTQIFLVRQAWVRRVALALICVAMILVQNTSAPFFKWSAFNIIGQIQYFLIGFLLADVYLTELRRNAPRNYLWDIVSLASFIMIVPVMVNGWATLFMLLVLIFTAYLGVFRGIIMNRIITNRWLTTIGGMCYTIYLFHELFVFGLGKYSLNLAVTRNYDLNFLVQSLLIVPVVIVASALLFVVVEKPFMIRDWPARFLAAVRGFRLGKREMEVALAEEAPRNV